MRNETVSPTAAEWDTCSIRWRTGVLVLAISLSGLRQSDHGSGDGGWGRVKASINSNVSSRVLVGIVLRVEIVEAGRRPNLGHRG